MSPRPGAVALVTGGARGLGVEICRQLAHQGMTVWCAARTIDNADVTANSLQADGDVRATRLDVTDPSTVHALTNRLDRLDVLINNAAIDYDTDQQAATADLARVDRAWQTNVLGAWRVTVALLPLLQDSDQARIVNVSSEAGSVSEMGAGPPAYHVTKAALNALTRTLAAELRTDGILVNAVCPGWTATDMGGGGRPVPEGAVSVVWAALLPNDGPTGGFFRDGQPLPW